MNIYVQVLYVHVFSISLGYIHRSGIAVSYGNSALQETWVQFLGWKDPREKDMATRPSILAWEIPRTKKRGELQFMKSQRVGHN